MNDKPHRVTPDEIERAVARMKAVVFQLRAGQGTEITRLTVLKRLCEDPRAASRFGLNLAERAAKRAKGKYRPLVMDALRQLRLHVAKPRSPARESLWKALSSLQESQNEHRRVKWAVVREIHSSPALVVEYAMRIALRPGESSHWGYRLAAFYAQRYDPSYGTGLIPASRSALEDIIRFWSRYKSGRGARRSPKGFRPAPG